MSRTERDATKARAQAAIDAASAAYARGALDEAEWQRRVTDSLADAYLVEDDPRWQSGFDGDPELWRQARELILDAVPTAGSFLDVGCANGHLMESLAIWARERDLALMMYGLELNPALADLARHRLPDLADHVYTGNAAKWLPPHRFDFVRTGLEYAAPGTEPLLIRHLLRDVVAPGGRLLVGPVNLEQRETTAAAFLDAGVAAPSEVSTTDRNGKSRSVFWTRATSSNSPAVNDRCS
jgi:SAM-dependent methyltransferase